MLNHKATWINEQTNIFSYIRDCLTGLTTPGCLCDDPFPPRSCRLQPVSALQNRVRQAALGAWALFNQFQTQRNLWPMTSYCGLHKSLLLQMVHRQTVRKRCEWINRGVMGWVSTPSHPGPGDSVARIYSCPVLPRPIRVPYHIPLWTVKYIIELTLFLSVFLCYSLGGAAVAVHSGLQGDVQACTRGAATEWLGCVRGAHPRRGQRRRAPASKGSHVRVQSPPLLQRIPRNRQRCQNLQNAGGRWGGLRVCVRVCFSSCMCFRPFRVYTILYAQRACVGAYNSCSQQAVRAGLCYVQMWCIQARLAECSAL